LHIPVSSGIFDFPFDLFDTSYILTYFLECTWGEYVRLSQCGNLLAVAKTYKFP